MFVVIEKIIAALAVGAVVYTAVFAGFWWIDLAEGSGEGFGCETFIV